MRAVPFGRDLSRRGFLGGLSLAIAGSSAFTGRRAGATEDDDNRWSTYRGDDGMSASSPLQGIDSYDRVAWSVEGGESATGPVVADGTAYVGADQRLLAVTIESGGGKWTYRAPGRLVGAPAVGEDLVIAVTEEGTVVSVDRSDGTELWSLGLDGYPGFPNVVDGTAYVGDHQGTVYALEAESGELGWSETLDTDISDQDGRIHRPCVAVDDGTLYVNVSDRGGSRLVALDPGGDLQWEFPMDVDAIFPPAVSSAGVCVGTRNDNYVTMVSKTGGIERWRHEIGPSGETPPAAGNGYVAAMAEGAGAADVVCHVYDAESGEEVWTSTMEEWNAPMDPTITADHVYFGGYTGRRENRLVAADVENGLERFDYRGSGGSLRHSPVPVSEGLFVPERNATSLLVSEAFESATETDDDSGDSSDASSETVDADAGSNGGSGDDGESASVAGTDGSSADSSSTDGSSGDRSLLSPTTINLVSDVVYILGAIVSGLLALVKGRQRFGGGD